ncbi:hypothetical protein V2S66_33365 [Streptomyces sp. V4-01]|uniref:Secreted protein n=1 Tax=Actinacidiphila polyblastidii TaxID=3110430 RepID=A0ABU7PLY5_9ACTN|nr:hypothetical protein [Streptomyces sp. V4-01]
MRRATTRRRHRARSSRGGFAAVAAALAAVVIVTWISRPPGTDPARSADARAGREACVPARWPAGCTQVFKKAEPYACSYAFDDSATLACKGVCF